MSLRLAIQKSGRLSEKSLELIAECDIKIDQGKRKLIGVSNDYPLEILYLRDDDIPQYVADGVADIGIVGENEVMEKDKNVKIVKRLGFSKCRLSLAIPKDEDYQGVEWFNGKRIATSYPHILKNFLNEKGIKADIEEISGSVEIAPSIGLAEGIFDIVSSGSTLVSNRLKEVEIVMQSEAMIISSKNLSAEKQALLDGLLFRIQTVQESKGNKYILLNAPNDKLPEIIKLLPGMKSPTILPLHLEGWSSIHTVINEKEFWGIIDKLKTHGAEGILVIPIEKMIK
ncbi:MAG: ATP phosphoribosyltransferase [Bacteroidales bacterium]|nr:ATP phosphoribosyltransferase [Bacteroidales bacterium]MBN2821008.1 ATP phosphoribosyltransferase [Bacteroidales bacterium]